MRLLTLCRKSVVRDDCYLQVLWKMQFDCLCKLGVLIIGALLVGGYIRAPDCWKLPFGSTESSEVNYAAWGDLSQLPCFLSSFAVRWKHRAAVGTVS